MSPSLRLALTVIAAAVAAGLTLAVAAWAIPTGSVTAVIAPLIVLAAAVLIRWRR